MDIPHRRPNPVGPIPNRMPKLTSFATRRMSGVTFLRSIPATFAAVLAHPATHPTGSFLVDFGIDPSTVPRIPFVDVLKGRFDPAVFAGRRIIVGATAVELGDQLAVPVYRVLPGVLIQALAYESLVQQRGMQRVTAVPVLLVAMMLALLLGPLLSARSWQSGLAGVGIVWATGLTVSCILQAGLAVVLDVTPWLLVTAFSYAYGIVREVDRTAIRAFLSTMAAMHRRTAVRNLIENSLDGIITANYMAKIESINPAAERLLGHKTDDIAGLDVDILIPSIGRGRAALEGIREAMAVGAAETKVQAKDGTVFPVDLLVTQVELSISKHKLERRETARSAYIFTIRDISERKRTEEALRESERRYRQMFQKNRAIKLLVDPSSGAVVDANQAAVDFYGYDMTTLKIMNIADINGLSQAGMEKEMAAVLSEEQTYSVSRHRLSSGDLRDVEIHSGPIEIDGRTIVFSIMHDITERRKAEDRIRHMASHDTLTNLPNRAQFMDRLEIALAQSRRDAKPGAIHFLDLDQFKPVNDVMGHDAGDRLLQAVARRIERCIRETDAAARFGGDEFAVLQPGLRSPDDATTLAIKLNAALSRPFITRGQEIHTSASIGVTVFPDDARDPARLMSNADMAMYQAKKDGGNTFRFFVSDMNSEAQTRVTMERGLRRAIEREELSLHFQPQVCLESGRIGSVEALLRWRHPELGFIAPSTFIPVAESSGLILSIGEWVLRTACKEAVVLQRPDRSPIGVSVNLSPVQFRDPNLLSTLEDALDSSGLDPTLLELEVTENAVMRQTGRTSEMLRAFEDMGIGLAIDDFGIGYSSLSYLREFPFKKIKIDRSFVRDLGTHSGSDAITRGIIHMGQSLDMKVVAEGVENRSQLSYLREQQCDEGQGYLFSRPMAMEHVGPLIDERAPFSLEDSLPGE